MIKPAFGKIDFEFHSTPQLWIATREGRCQCSECLVYGMGKTKEAAAEALIEAEDQADG